MANHEDYDEICATLATKFQKNDLEYCRNFLQERSPLSAANIAVGVYVIFMTAHLEYVRKWFAFLRDEAHNS